ncbi:MAG: Spy/CpxP family protein refolding chaperone [candidate division WOR-3 bacterium]
MKKLTKLNCLLVIAGALVFTGWAMAQEPKEEPALEEHPPMMMPPLGLMDLPNLTDAQREQIQALRIKHLKEILPIETEVRIKEIELDALWQAEKFDAKEIIAKVKEIGELKNKLELARVKQRIEIYKILTPEQRKTLRRGFGMRKNMRREMRKRFRLMEPSDMKDD